MTVQDVGRFSKLFDIHTNLGDSNGFWALISNLMIYPHPKSVEPLQGGLVESWEQVDKSTLTFKIRQGVNLHARKPTNGRPLVAKDILFNLERITGKYDPQRVAIFTRRSSLAGMDKVEAVDDRTLKITFSTPNALFLNGLADFRQAFVPPEVVQNDPDFKKPAEFVGSGPFMVDSWDDLTATGTYVPNPNYWEKGMPYLDKIQEVQFPDTAAALAAFISGKTDIATAGTMQDRTTVQKGRPEAKLVTAESLTWSNFRMNQTRTAFKDQRVRKALFLALNYAELNDASAGKGFWDYTGPLVAGLPGAWTSDQLSKMSGWDSSQKQKDITDAKALMTSAGFPDGKLEFGVMPNSQAAADNVIRIQDQLLKIWPAMNLKVDIPPDGTTFTRRQTSGDFDMLWYSYVAVPEATLEASLHYRTNNSRNYTKISDPEIDRLCDAAVVEFDTNARRKIADDLQKKLLDVMYLMPTGKSRTTFTMQPRIQGFEGNSGVGTFTLYDIDIFAKKVWIA